MMSSVGIGGLEMSHACAAPYLREIPQDRLGARHLFGRAVRHDQKSVSLHSAFIGDRAVPRNAAAVEQPRYQTN